MRIAVLVVVVGCAASPPVTLGNHVAIAASPPHHVLPIADGAWHLHDAAHVAAGRLALDYCCRYLGIARHGLPPLEPGTWVLAIDHANSECTTAARAVVSRSTPGGELHPGLGRADLTAGAAGAIATTTFEVTDPAPLELQIVADGGLHCCGTTTIRSVAVRPFARR